MPQLKALTDKTKALKENKLHHLGELMVATGADAIDMETLAGGLLAMTETNDAAQKEAWRSPARRFFGEKHAKLRRELPAIAESAQAGNSGRCTGLRRSRHDTTCATGP